MLNVSKTDPDNERVFIVDHAQIELSLGASGSNGQIVTSRSVTITRISLFVPRG